MEQARDKKHVGWTCGLGGEVAEEAGCAGPRPGAHVGHPLVQPERLQPAAVCQSHLLRLLGFKVEDITHTWYLKSQSKFRGITAEHWLGRETRLIYQGMASLAVKCPGISCPHLLRSAMLRRHGKAHACDML